MFCWLLVGTLWYRRRRGDGKLQVSHQRGRWYDCRLLRWQDPRAASSGRFTESDCCLPKLVNRLPDNNVGGLQTRRNEVPNTGRLNRAEQENNRTTICNKTSTILQDRAQAQGP
ncbi:hypothetical protein F2Q69_00049972 [Brassica cretica]|uniref:Uncharacterized protein n=1 Tax=Brassica cretica TaxID=69181 RepID=A0A8S9PK33_BRACR|nr:hypothetical protein F2Q69_00049972 [Brassica cretica]